MTSTYLSNKNQSLTVIIETTGKGRWHYLSQWQWPKEILGISAVASISPTRGAPLDNILANTDMPWEEDTGISTAWDYYVKVKVKVLVAFIEIYHFRFAKMSPLQQCLLWPPNLSLYLPTLLHNYSFTAFTMSILIFFFICLLSIFFARLSVPWVQMACLFCFHSISGPWGSRRSIVLVRIGQSLLW